MGHDLSGEIRDGEYVETLSGSCGETSDRKCGGIKDGRYAKRFDGSGDDDDDVCFCHLLDLIRVCTMTIIMIMMIITLLLLFPGLLQTTLRWRWLGCNC